MSIYIKTDMEKMPKRCKDCERVKYHEGYPHCMGGTPIYCHITMMRPDWCPLVEIPDEDIQFSQIISEMAKNQTMKKTLKIHTEKQIAEFEIKLVSMEFKEKKDV